MSDLPESIARNVTIDPETGEWIWSGLLDKDGYGRYSSEGVHRVVYRLMVGPIRPGYQVDHVKAWGCTSRACLSPWHLEAVTARENTMRSSSFAAVNAMKTKCDSGHLFDLFNTYYRPDGHRDCRVCIRFRVAKYKRRIREAANASELLELRPAA